MCSFFCSKLERRQKPDPSLANPCLAYARFIYFQEIYLFIYLFIFRTFILFHLFIYRRRPDCVTWTASLALLLFWALLRFFAVANEQTLKEPRVAKEAETERVDAVPELRNPGAVHKQRFVTGYLAFGAPKLGKTKKWVVAEASFRGPITPKKDYMKICDTIFPSLSFARKGKNACR